MGWFKDFLLSVFGNVWEHLGALLVKLMMGPVVFFLFGPLFRFSERIANYILNQIKPFVGDVGMTTESLLAWFVDCLRLADCVTALMTFLVMGFLVSIIKRFFS